MYKDAGYHFRNKDMKSTQMKKSSIFFCIFLLCFSSAFAEKITIDSAVIQEYKGKLGRWLPIPSQTALAAAAKEASLSLNEIYAINDVPARKNPVGGYLFIPYSQDAITSFAEKGITRPQIESDDDEFLWPIDDVMSITSVLGLRGGKFHTGMDIPASRGTRVRSAMDGRVVFSGYAGGFGNFIQVEHRNNFVTRYAHNSINLVKKGDFVKKGQLLGFVGSTGNSTGNHLHFEVRCNDVPLDPLDFLPVNGNLKLLHTIKNWK